MFKNLREKCNNLIKLGRYNRPTGAFLLMWPCFWGALSSLSIEVKLFKYLILFFVGAFVMRGVGCCINDFFDMKIDRLVKRTKNRPLANGKVSINEAFIFVIIQLILGLIILLQFDFEVIILGFFIFPFIIVYPLLKRFTYFPQFLLGFVFNWGILIGYTSLNEYFDLRIILLYIAGVFLTISYDTVYGFQDIKDDKKIGVKSFSILIEKRANIYLLCTYFISFLFFCIFFFSFYSGFFFNLTISLIILFFFGIQFFQFLNRKNLLKIFNSNALYGAIISILLLFRNYL